MSKLQLKIYKTHELVTIPKFQTKQSACFDICYNHAGKTQYSGINRNNSPFTRFFTNATIHIAAGERVMVPTGLIFDIPVGYSVRIHPRSGISYKQGIVLANCEGVIDSDYVEEVYLLLVNTTENAVTFNIGDRLAQGELVKNEVYDISETKQKPGVRTDRTGGMGSTGVNTVVVVSPPNVGEKNV